MDMGRGEERVRHVKKKKERKRKEERKKETGLLKRDQIKVLFEQ